MISVFNARIGGEIPYVDIVGASLISIFNKT